MGGYTGRKGKSKTKGRNEGRVGKIKDMKIKWDGKSKRREARFEIGEDHSRHSLRRSVLFKKGSSSVAHSSRLRF